MTMNFYMKVTKNLGGRKGSKAVLYCIVDLFDQAHLAL